MKDASPLRRSAVAIAVGRAKTLIERNGFFAARRGERAPDSVMGRARIRSVIVNVVDVARIDRVGNEVNGAVHHTGVDAAVVGAAGRNEVDRVMAVRSAIDIRPAAANGIRG